MGKVGEPPQILRDYLENPGVTLLIKGLPGTGKTILSLEIISSLRKTKGMYFSTRLTKESFIKKFPSFSKSIKPEQVIELPSMKGRLRSAGLEPLYSFMNVSDPRMDLHYIFNVAGRNGASCIVIDSWDAIISGVEPDKRAALEDEIIKGVSEAKLSLVLISETAKHISLDYLVDGIVKLEKKYKEDKEKVKTKYETSKSEIKELIKTFYEKGYTHGASYLEKLSDRLFTNVEFWLKTGVIAPKTTSLLERVFREIGRRLKKIAWGWSDKAVTNISKMIMIKQYSRDKWETYWKEKLGIKGYFDIQIVSVTS